MPFLGLVFNDRLGNLDDEVQEWNTHEIEEIATTQDYYEYALIRYHRTHQGDDDAYYIYGFDDDDTFDVNSSPPEVAQSWNHNSETIVGNCNTCQAMPYTNFGLQAKKAREVTTYMYTFVGAAMACLGWAAVLIKTLRAPSVDQDSPGTSFLEPSAGQFA